MLLRLGQLDYLMRQRQVHNPANFHLLASLQPAHIEALLQDKDVPLLFISRNPYIRLLSTYLEKSAKNLWSTQPYQGKDSEVLHALRNYPIDTFAELVKKLHALCLLLGKQLPRQAGVNHHYVSQATRCGFAQGVVYDYVVKLERTNEWYDNVVNELGLYEHVSNGWPTAEKCFLSTADNPCDGPVVVRDQFGGVTF